jgi:hypothetical protein
MDDDGKQGGEVVSRGGRALVEHVGDALRAALGEHSVEVEFLDLEEVRESRVPARERASSREEKTTKSHGGGSDDDDNVSTLREKER